MVAADADAPETLERALKATALMITASPLAAQVVPSPYRFLEKVQGIGVNAGEAITFNVVALGAPTYQWQKGSDPIPGAGAFSVDIPANLVNPVAGIAAGRQERPVGVDDLAPTLARILGMEPPSPSAGRPLF